MGKVNYVNLNKLPESRRPDWKPWEALAKARDYQKGDYQCDHGHSFKGYCAHLTFCCYGMLSSGYYDAHSMWRNTPRAFKRYDRNPPAGAIALYVGGSHGHAALVDTFGGIFTNDIDESGRYYVAGAYSRTPLLAPERAFGHRYVGWIFPYAISVEDGRTPPKTKSHSGGGNNPPPKDLDMIPGWFKVTASVLNGRERPTTKSKVGNRWERGDRVFLEKAVRNDGRRWQKTDKSGLWVAAGYVERVESKKKDRRDHRKGVNQGPTSK